MINLTPQQKKRLVGHFPELSTYFTLQEIKDKKPEADAFLVAFINKLDTIKGDKGDKGDMPIKGKDYLTNTEINQLISHVVKQATPIKGIHYTDGKNGDNYILTPKDKKEIAAQIPAVEKVIERTEIIKEVSRKLSVEDVKGAVSKDELEIEKKNILDGMAKIDGRIKLTDQRWHGGGLSKVSTDSTLTGNGTPSSPLHVVGSTGTWYQDEIVATGQTGTSFSLLHTPQSVVFLYKNGQYLVSGAGQDYTRVGSALTLAASLLSTDLLTATYS